jgi:hypothetical protein
MITEIPTAADDGVARQFGIAVQDHVIVGRDRSRPTRLEPLPLHGYFGLERQWSQNEQ